MLSESETPNSGALHVVSQEVLSPRLREVTLRTDALATPADFPLGPNAHGETKVRILLPDGYGANPDRRYPVLYLLHGGTENYSTWTTPEVGGQAEDITLNAELIVVMPDGGVAGGYSDWFNGGAHGAPQWATYHLDELIPWVDSVFQTIDGRSGRAIAGLSMGGAALRYAAQRPELFGATASFSGDIDILNPASAWHNGGRFISHLIWGDPVSQELRWRAVNGPDLAENLRNTDVALYAGDTGIPESTFILDAAMAMRDRLDALGISHRYTIYPGMGHDWRTFNRALEDWLPLLMDALPAVDPRPAAFDYRTVRTEFGIFSWTLQATRKEPGFLHFRVESDLRFSLHGPGHVLVRTPGNVENRSRRARVTVSADGAVEQDDLTADGDGRLLIEFATAESAEVSIEWLPTADGGA